MSAATLFVGAVLLSSAPPAAAQRDEFQLWNALFANVGNPPDGAPVSGWLDLHVRRGTLTTVHILRLGLGYHPTDWLSLHVGYAWIPVFVDGPGGTANEQRLWQQAVLAHRLGGFAMQARTRIEQRFSDQGDDVAFRFRQFVRLGWQPSAAVPLGVALWDEVFVGGADTDWGAPGGLDQNRVFIGPFVQAAPFARIEAGYLFVFLDREPADLLVHALALNVFFRWRGPERVASASEPAR